MPRNLLPIHPFDPLCPAAERCEIQLSARYAGGEDGGADKQAPRRQRPRRLSMKLAVASLVLLAGLSGAAGAQSLAYGVTLGNVQAVRDINMNVSTITGSLANQSGRPISSAVLTFVLYDAQGREVGRVNDDVIGPMAPGQIRLVKAITPLQFTRVTVLDIRAQ